MTPPVYRDNKCGNENRQDMEMLPLSVPTVIRHQQMGTKDDGLLMPHNRLSLVLETVDDTVSQNCYEDHSVSKYQNNTDQGVLTFRSSTGGGSIDSPHPIKHCQLYCNRGS